MEKKVAVLLIDPQNDFHEGGSLAVGGSSEDAERIAEMIKGRYLLRKTIYPHDLPNFTILLLGNSASIDSIFVTLDSHQRTHIAHSIFWCNAEGKRPDPFTIISADSVKEKTWKPVNQDLQVKKCQYSGEFV